MMTNAQMWVAISVPSFLVLVGILMNARGLDKLRHDMDRMEDRIDKRFVAMEDRIDKRFAAIDSRMAAFEARMASIEERLLNLIFDHEKRIGQLESKKLPTGI